MMDDFINNVPGAWAIVISLCIVLGYGAGVVHFRSLEAVVVRLVAGRLSAVALQVARFAMLGLVLYLLARLGAVPLIAGTVGIMLAKLRVVARAGGGR